jgi:hypothetical protein
MSSNSKSKSISNKSTKLHSFITTGDKFDDFELTLVPTKTALYQGTDFDLENEKIEDYYNHYEKKHKGFYFLSTYKVASINATSMDSSKIVYTTIPTRDDITYKTRKNNYEYIYPLYYVGSPMRYIIKYTVNNNLNLIDIGKHKNVIKLWNIIKSLDIDKRSKESHFYDLSGLYENNFDYEGKKTPAILRRRKEFDNNIIKLFIDIFKPYFKSEYNIDIDGWIYYSTDTKLNDEIVLINNKSLEFKEITKSKTYSGIPSYDEYKQIHDSQKVNINSLNDISSILYNYY